MVRAFTQGRPGHPRWAVPVTASLLVLSLLLAAWLTRSKARARYVALEDASQILADARLEARLPAGWTEVRSRLAIIPGVAAELRSTRAKGEALVLFRGLPRPTGTVAQDAAEAGRRLATLLGAGVPREAGYATMGAFPAWTAVFGPSRPDRSLTHFLVRAAMAPDGQIFGALIVLPHRPMPEDFQFMEDFSRHLKLMDIQPVDQPESVLEEAGIVFRLPAGARLFTSTRPKPAAGGRLLLAGGRAESGWFLEVGRLPLIGTRTAHQIVADYARSARQIMQLPSAGEQRSLGQRSGIRIFLPKTQDEPSPLLVWCARIDENTALVLAGRAEPEGQAELERVCETILKESRVTSFAETVDFQQALEHGRRWMDTIRQEGLTASWQKHLAEPLRYVVRGPALPLRKKIQTYEVQTDEDGFRWWTLRMKYLPLTPAIHTPLDIEEYWSVREDAVTHGHKYTRALHGRPQLVYTELRPPGKNIIRREMAIGGQTVRWEVSIDRTYGCEPVLIEAAGRIATEPDPQPAIFSATEQFVEQPCYWLVVPLGEAPLPGPDTSHVGRAVRLIRDYDPAAIDLYFDSEGGLLAVNFDNLLWEQRASETRAGALRMDALGNERHAGAGEGSPRSSGEKTRWAGP